MGSKLSGYDDGKSYNGGYIWHYVTDVAVSDYSLNQEVLGTGKE